MKKYLYVLGAIVVVLIIMLMLISRKAEAPIVEQTSSPTSTIEDKKPVQDPLNFSYRIDGEIVTLKDGTSSKKNSSGRASEIITEAVGQPAYGDIGGGAGSAVMFIAQQGGGTGVFVYAVATYLENGTYKGAEAFFLGDRIVPKSIRIVNGAAEVSYLDRVEGQAMAEEPTVSVTKALVLQSGVLKEK